MYPDLVRDGFMDSILKSAGEAEEVSIDPQGQWTPSDPHKEKKRKSSVFEEPPLKRKAGPKVDIVDLT